MSHRYYDVSKITLGENGKIELGDEQLAKLEKEQIEELTAGGLFLYQNELGEEFKINAFSCEGERNAGQRCANWTNCRITRNEDFCTNNRNCDGSMNTIDRCGSGTPASP